MAPKRAVAGGRPGTRLFLALVVLATVIAVEFYLVNLPAPLEVSSTSATTLWPVKIASGQQQIIVEGVGRDASGLLASHEGRKDELVEAYFERAHLSGLPLTRIQALKTPGGAPPSDWQRIELVSDEAREYVKPESPPAAGEPELRPEEAAAAKDDTCTTSILIYHDGDQLPIPRLRLFQKEGSGRDIFRLAEIAAEGTELKVVLDTESPKSGSLRGNDNAPGCKKILKVGGWTLKVQGSRKIELIVAAGEGFRFRFNKLKPGASVWEGGSGGAYDPFVLYPSPLKVAALSVSAEGGAPPEPLRVTAADEKSPLEIRKILIGSDELAVDYAGRAFVQKRGHYESVDLFERVDKYRTVAGLLAAANAAILGWVILTAKESWKKMRTKPPVPRVSSEVRPRKERR